jgi:hypothetical protein
MPPRRIRLIPRHPPRRPQNTNPSGLRAAQKPSFTFHQALPGKLSLPPGTRTRDSLVQSIFALRVLSPRKLDPPILDVPLRALQRALNPRDKVEVAVEGGFGGELAALEVCGWIADAGALGPEFMAACAGEGAGACCAAWAAVFWGVDVAGRAWLDWIVNCAG